MPSAQTTTLPPLPTPPALASNLATGSGGLFYTGSFHQLGVQVLGLATVGEGIEHPAQAERLRQLGCRFGQGYLFAPPLEASALERFLEDHIPAFA